MRVAALALGTRGDLELALLLGRELRRRGHDVVVATSPFLSDMVRHSGLDWLQVGTGDRERMLSVLRAMGSGMPWHTRAQYFLDSWCDPELSFAARSGQLRSLVADADYVVNNLKLVFDRKGGFSEADAEIVPGAVFTYDPPVRLEEVSLFPPPPGQRKDVLDLVALSQPLFDPAGEWGKQYRFTGFWIDPLHYADRWNPPQALAEFLAAGPPPVVITPGSTIGFDTGVFVARIIEALQAAGFRGVLLPGWSVVPESPAPDLLHVAGEVPYRWIFPRASCVVHHGSHGATATALHAGKASVVVPHIPCQEIMGRALLWAGVGTAIVAPDALDAEVLARGLLLAVNHPAVADAVDRWRATVAAEPGVVLAADLIERHHELGFID